MAITERLDSLLFLNFMISRPYVTCLARSIYSSIYTPGAEPEFIEEDIIRTIIPTTQMTTQIPTQMTTQIPTQIVELRRQDPTMSMRKLALALKDITGNGVKYHLDKMKEEGRIKRIGGTRGKWEVLD